MVTNEEWEIHLKVPARAFYLELVRKVIVDLAAKVGFPREDLAKIEMAVDEACTNVIEYAYVNHKNIRIKSSVKAKGESITYPIELRVNINPERILVIMKDKGKRFDFDTYGNINIDDYLSRMKVGGLGIYVIKTFMDEVRYVHKRGMGNELRMVKYLKR